MSLPQLTEAALVERDAALARGEEPPCRALVPAWLRVGSVVLLLWLNWRGVVLVATFGAVDMADRGTGRARCAVRCAGNGLTRLWLRARRSDLTVLP